MNILKKLDYIGSLLGCHRMPKRSLFYKGRQFPVCARCTGVFFGQTAAIVIFKIFIPKFSVLIILCAVMFLDWLIQYLKILTSTNIRRVVTGFAGGYGLMTIEIIALKAIIKSIIEFIL